jgi:hypothetical protein
MWKIDFDINPDLDVWGSGVGVVLVYVKKIMLKIIK